MDADKSKVDSFHTTHDHYFQQRVGEDYRPPTQTQSIHGSSIPQGDILRAEVPISDYKYKFSGNDGAKVVRAKNMHHGRIYQIHMFIFLCVCNCLCLCECEYLLV